MNYPVIVTAGIFVSAIAISGISYVSAYNAGNRMEQNIVSTYENNRNVLATYGNKITEAAQVPSMMKDDILEVTKGALEGRYGENGSRAIFQMIQEQNPQVSSELYVQLQRIIEAGRDEFKISQTKLIDQKRVYETDLGSFWRGTWLSVAGYPKINLDEYQIVSTSRANEAFDTKLEEPMKLR